MFILLLLANKADESFSCYPSIRTTDGRIRCRPKHVMRALKELEASGFITRERQLHDSGARRSSHSPQMRPHSVGRNVSELDSRGGERIGEQCL
jgi:DNA-binding transcriptional regulator YhcF (GntR family)